MKRLFACAAILSLTLLACGDNGSSAGPDQRSVEGDSSASETELSSGSEDPESSATVESSASTESSDSVESSTTVGSSSGTAPESSGSAESSATAESSSDVTDSSSSGNSPESSATVESSSGAVQSSSSSGGRAVQQGIVAGAQCMTSKGGNSSIPGGDGMALPPHAALILNDGSEYVAISVDHVMMPCYRLNGFNGFELEMALLKTVQVESDGDTLYVNQLVDETLVEDNCSCLAEAHILIKEDPDFTSAEGLRLEDLSYRFYLYRE